MFKNLIEKSKEISIEKENSKIKYFLGALISFESKNVFLTFVPQIKFLHKLYLHVC